jgi:hypothetical protein
MGVMTYKILAFYTLKHLGNYRRFYTISFENPKTIRWRISGGNAPPFFFFVTRIARLLLLNELITYLSVRFTY